MKYLSADSVGINDDVMMYPTEYLNNSLTMPSFSIHKLQLKRAHHPIIIDLNRVSA